MPMREDYLDAGLESMKSIRFSFAAFVKASNNSDCEACLISTLIGTSTPLEILPESLMPARPSWTRRNLLVFAFFLTFSPAGSAADRDVWLNWRGPNRDSVVQDATWPESLDESHLKLVWSQPFSDSYSGPLVTEQFVFTTETVDGSERVTCLDRVSGEIKWAKDWKGAMTVPFFAARNGSWIRSTPATDGEILFVGGIRDVLVALNCKTGEELWRIDFAEKFGKVPDFGMVCSPLIDGEYLYVQAGKGLHKIYKKSGDIVWSSLVDDGNIMSSGAFSSPVIATLHDKRQLLVQTRTFLAGVDLDSGSPLWKYEVAAFRGMNILTPTVWDNGIFTSSYGGRSLLLDIASGSSTGTRWENKLEGYMSSPVVIDHYVYMHLRNKRFACIDLKTGKEMWVTRPYGEYWSMVTNGKQILALDQTGKLRLIAHDPAEFKLLDERKLTEEESWAHIAVAGSSVVVRTQKSLQMYNWTMP
jgi:outer membrane protein assembly factor BamB